MLRVQEALTDERDRAKERHRVAATTAAAAARSERQRDVQRDRRPHDLKPASRVRHGADLRFVRRRRHVDERALSLEQACRRRCEHGRHARCREPRELRRVGPDTLAASSSGRRITLRFQRSASSSVRNVAGAAGGAASSPAALPMSIRPG